jgi:hypothetical protein
VKFTNAFVMFLFAALVSVCPQLAAAQQYAPAQDGPVPAKRNTASQHVSTEPVSWTAKNPDGDTLGQVLNELKAKLAAKGFDYDTREGASYYLDKKCCKGSVETLTLSSMLETIFKGLKRNWPVRYEWLNGTNTLVIYGSAVPAPPIASALAAPVVTPRNDLVIVPSGGPVAAVAAGPIPAQRYHSVAYQQAGAPIYAGNPGCGTGDYIHARMAAGLIQNGFGSLMLGTGPNSLPCGGGYANGYPTANLSGYYANGYGYYSGGRPYILNPTISARAWRNFDREVSIAAFKVHGPGMFLDRVKIYVNGSLKNVGSKVKSKGGQKVPLPLGVTSTVTFVADIDKQSACYSEPVNPDSMADYTLVNNGDEWYLEIPVEEKSFFLADGKTYKGLWDHAAGECRPNGSSKR